MKKSIFIQAAILLLSAGCRNAVINPTAPAQPVACTQEAKLCPDGSYVTRTGPKCEFTACPSQAKSSSAAHGAALQISTLSPSSGPVGTKVTITGRGFTSTGNTVSLNNYKVTGNVSSSNGTTLQFSVPATLAPDCGQGMMCPNYFLPVSPGSDNINVSNANGTSNSMAFTVTP